MYSSAVSTERATVEQYNRLRADAKGSSWLIPHEQETPNNTVKVEYGRWVRNNPTRDIVEFATQSSSGLTAPSVNPRIDLISSDTSGNLVITGGSEAVSPTPPALPDGHLEIGHVYLRVGGTVIKDEDNDDSTNHYIIDRRPFIFEPLADVIYQTNVETLSGSKSLDTAEGVYQALDPDGGNRDVTLETSGMIDGRPFYIRNNGTDGTLIVKQSSTELLRLGVSQSALFAFDGDSGDWVIILEGGSPRYGDGRDGALNVTSGTTQIDASTAVNGLLIKQYTSFNVSVGATLEFINVPDEGLMFVVLCQGNYTMAGTIDGAGDGTLGGTGVSVSREADGASSSAGNNATNVHSALRFGQNRYGGGGARDTDLIDATASSAAGGGGSGANPSSDGTAGSSASSTNSSAGGGSAGASLTTALLKLLSSMYGVSLFPGCGGGSGGVAVAIGNNSYSSGTIIATSGNGGRGGASILAICGGNFSQTGTVNLSGTSAASSSIQLCTIAGSNRGQSASAGGSAGGTAGCFAGFARGTITNSATYTLNAGSASNGASQAQGSGGGASSSAAAGNGAAGIAGTSLVVPLAL